MSTKLLCQLGRSFWLVLIATTISCCWNANLVGQEMSVTVNVFPNSSRVLIEGTGAPETKWSFLDSYAGMVGLAGRIEKFALADAGGSEMEVRKLAPGQYESSKAATRFRY